MSTLLRSYPSSRLASSTTQRSNHTRYLDTEEGYDHLTFSDHDWSLGGKIDGSADPKLNYLIRKEAESQIHWQSDEVVVKTGWALSLRKATDEDIGA